MFKKSQLQKLGQIRVFAGSPLSLARNLRQTSEVYSLLFWKDADLLSLFNRLTKRENTEIGWGLAYATLVALLMKEKEGHLISFDPSRIPWGDEIAVFFRRRMSPVSESGVSKSISSPISVKASSSDSEYPDFIVFGLDGKPIQRGKPK